MKSRLFNRLEQAIEKMINDAAEDGNYWDGLIHPSLSKEMATAAAQVFDAAMNGQAYAEKEKG